MDFHSEDWNYPLQSVVMVAGTPNLETHICMKALAMVTAESSVIGIASGHRVN